MEKLLLNVWEVFYKLSDELQYNVTNARIFYDLKHIRKQNLKRLCNPKQLTDDSHVKLGSLTHAELINRTKNTEYDRMLTWKSGN